MTAREAFNLSNKRWEELEDRFLAQLRGIVGAEDEGAALLAALITGMKPKEREALALGVMIGRVSMFGLDGLVGAKEALKVPAVARGSS